MSPSRSFSACMQRALFFLRFFFCLVALHSTPHGALRSAICRGQNTRLYLRYTTQRGGGCVVAQGDVLPICLVGGLQGTEQNGIETPKSRKNLKEEERVCVCVCQCCCERYWRDGPRRYRYREHLARVCFAPSPPLPLGASWCGGVQRNNFTVISAERLHNHMNVAYHPAGWAEALLHLHLLLGARVVRTVDLVHLRYNNPALHLSPGLQIRSAILHSIIKRNERKKKRRSGKTDADPITRWGQVRMCFLRRAKTNKRDNEAS